MSNIQLPISIVKSVEEALFAKRADLFDVAASGDMDQMDEKVSDYKHFLKKECNLLLNLSTKMFKDGIRDEELFNRVEDVLIYISNESENIESGIYSSSIAEKILKFSKKPHENNMCPMSRENGSFCL